MRRLSSSNDAHTNMWCSIQEIVSDECNNKKSDRRRKKISDLFPELELENDRDIYHITASIAEDIVSTKRFASVSRRNSYMNNWLDSFHHQAPSTALKCVAQALDYYSGRSAPYSREEVQYLLVRAENLLDSLDKQSSYSRLKNDVLVASTREQLWKTCESSCVSSLQKASQLLGQVSNIGA